MLVGSGQPVEVVRSISDAQGDPFDPPALPAATVTCTLSLETPDPATATCVVRKVDEGLYAARIPAAFLVDVATLRLDWAWSDSEPVTARDSVEVTSVPVCTAHSVGSLAGSKAREVPLWKQLAAISQATRMFESATNVDFSPRIAKAVLPYPGPPPVLDLSDVSVVVCQPNEPVEGLATYLYVTGMPEPPEDVTRAVAILASSIMTDGPWDDRGMAVSDEAGTVRLLTAGVGRTMFSIPEVEATARRYRQPVFA